MGVCTTRHWQTPGRLVQGLNICTVHVQCLAARAWYPTTCSIANRFSGHWCMDGLTTERSLDLQTTRVIDVLGLFFAMSSMGVCATRHWQTTGRLVQGLHVRIVYVGVTGMWSMVPMSRNARGMACAPLIGWPTCTISAGIYRLGCILPRTTEKNTHIQWHFHFTDEESRFIKAYINDNHHKQITRIRNNVYSTS